MLNWEQINYDITKSEIEYNSLNNMNPATIASNLNSEFKRIRELLIQARDDIFDEWHLDTAENLGYDFDLLFAIRLYDILGLNNNFSNRAASNDEIWRFLSIRVIPDIVHSRWGMNEARYMTSRRIWLKNLWWYIHLSWNGDTERTYEILKNNTTDTVLQLVERPGVGYYVSLYREIMLRYSCINDPSRTLFRKVLKLNTALLPVTYPELISGGIKEYVSYLFRKVQ
ncbi:hypothetical protein J1C95_03055 [Streptococcus sanguinis]|jgi:hypothetical protein|uniref:Uncharacterized protein n=1 Tax=Streptococcus sanguinis TaxID=1305 RepID=A0AB74DHT2_STRSA|nr:hypothetical protein [Streptococcus sanguinis]MCY7033488.1 hypothetical protein [Streptococcus sanguinis]RSI28839.1 hypothetical protein D8879_10225 [Streptococcus sanguinis]RSI31992.1 hypothetical protein D8878_11285 [Streptococcus sanguinis]RSI48014.1 hypothetical protein D8871_07920 [Streptococcus sanguinis]